MYAKSWSNPPQLGCWFLLQLAGLADPPPGTGFMFTLQSLAKMMMMGVMIMRDDVCGLFSTNIPMIPPYSI